MSHTDSTYADSRNDENDLKDSKKRTSYVSRDHVSMVEFVTNIYKNLGHGEYHSNKQIATIHKLSPVSIKQHLTSCQQYRMLELKFGVGYKVTDLFKRIILPFNENEKKAAIIESLKSPETYQNLFKQYEFHILPPLEGIKNHFVRNFHFREEIAEKSAQVFLTNLEDYKLIDSRGVLVSGLKLLNNGNSETQNNVETSEKEDPLKKSEEPKALVQSEEGVKMIDIVIPLKSTKHKAHLLLPEDYKEEDLERISKFVEALK